MDPFIRVVDNELILPGVKRKHVFLHISDTHIAAWDDLSTEEEKEEAIASDEHWKVSKENFARKFREPFSEARQISTAAGFVKLLTFAREENPDALILTGDNLEWMHPAGERFLCDRMKDFPLPFLAVPGNHENASLTGVWEPGVHVLDFGAFRIAAVDDRLGTVASEDLDRLEELAAEGVPMIVCCHIPVAAKCNRDFMQQFGVYFSINRETEDENGRRFVNFLETSPAVKMTLCGHIHGYSDTELVPGKRQITASQGMIGFVHCLTVQGEK